MPDSIEALKVEHPDLAELCVWLLDRWRETEIQLKAADEGLLKCSDPTKSWQGRTAECAGWMKRALAAEQENGKLRSAIQAMAPFLHRVDCKHLRSEEEIRQGKDGPEKWYKVSGWVAECPDCNAILASNAASRLMYEALGIYGDGSPRDQDPALVEVGDWYWSEDKYGTRDFMPCVGGKPFRCSCGCNVFKRATNAGLKYRCNSCRAVYAGDRNELLGGTTMLQDSQELHAWEKWTNSPAAKDAKSSVSLKTVFTAGRDSMKPLLQEVLDYLLLNDDGEPVALKDLCYCVRRGDDAILRCLPCQVAAFLAKETLSRIGTRIRGKVK